MPRGEGGDDSVEIVLEEKSARDCHLCNRTVKFPHSVYDCNECGRTICGKCRGGQFRISGTDRKERVCRACEKGRKSYERERIQDKIDYAQESADQLRKSLSKKNAQLDGWLRELSRLSLMLDKRTQIRGLEPRVDDGGRVLEDALTSKDDAVEVALQTFMAARDAGRAGKNALAAELEAAEEARARALKELQTANVRLAEEEASCAEKEEELRRLERASDQRDLRRTKVKELEEEVARVEAEAARLELGIMRGGLDSARSERPGTGRSGRSQATSTGRVGSRPDPDVEGRRGDHVPVKVGTRLAGSGPGGDRAAGALVPSNPAQASASASRQLSPGRGVLSGMSPRLVTIANGVQDRVERAKCTIQ